MVHHWSNGQVQCIWIVSKTNLPTGACAKASKKLWSTDLVLSMIHQQGVLVDKVLLIPTGSNLNAFLMFVWRSWRTTSGHWMAANGVRQLVLLIEQSGQQWYQYGDALADGIDDTMMLQTRSVEMLTEHCGSIWQSSHGLVINFELLLILSNQILIAISRCAQFVLTLIIIIACKPHTPSWCWNWKCYNDKSISIPEACTLHRRVYKYRLVYSKVEVKKVQSLVCCLMKLFWNDQKESDYISQTTCYTYFIRAISNTDPTQESGWAV